MKKIKYTLWGYLILLSFGWWLTDPTPLASLNGFFDWRNLLNQYTGILGIGIMSLAMMLALRPTFVEPYLGGLDKMYRLHKWLGIAGLAISISHWLIAKGPKWLVALGWLERRGRKPRPTFPDGSWQQLLSSQRGLAETVGEWAFYLALVLMVLALIKRFPYKRFFQTHRILALTYLAFVFHAVILVKFDYWRGPIGPILAVLMTLGSIGAVMALFRQRVGAKPAVGEVVGLEHQAALNVLCVDIALKSGWAGHQPGQFAFVTFHAEEGPHPFTIASAWQGDGRIRFMIKALGDYTRTLPERLKVGDPVRLEGPYGRFNFAGAQARQIWIGGGIGITPFIARLKSLLNQTDGKSIDLFHCTSAYDPSIINRLTEDAAAAKVSLHVLWDQRDGRLDPDYIMRTVPDWKDADIWFCGPALLGQIIRDTLCLNGLPSERFHQELFEMR